MVDLRLSSCAFARSMDVPRGSKNHGYNGAARKEQPVVERFKAYFERLQRLSSEDLDRSAEKLVRREKRNVALLIAHLAEISRRKVELERGYRNLFDYCVRRLNLSEGSVALRLQVANVSRRFPQILVALAENRVSLTVAGLLAPHLSEENVEKLLSDCAGMTKRVVEEYLVAIRPKPVFTPSIRKQPAPPEKGEMVRSQPQPAAIPSFEPTPAAPEVEKPPREPERSTAPLLAPARPDQFNFRFAADRRFKEKFERLAEVLGVENPRVHMAEVLGRALDAALDQKDPKRRRERRIEKERKRNAPEGKSRPDENSDEVPAESRYISSEVRECLQERAGYQCEFRASDGTRCTARTRLEIEHDRPFAIFRSHDKRFLKVLCRRHNRLRAEQVYGAEFVQARIDEARRQRLSEDSSG